METRTAQRMLSVTTIMDDEVVNAQNEKIATIEDLMLDVETGRTRFAVLSSGGFLGIGENFVAIPYDLLRVDFENERCVLDVPKDRFENAPTFDRNDWPDFSDPEVQERIRNHWETSTVTP